MLAKNHSESSAGLNSSLALSLPPHRPLRAKRPIPDPSGAHSLGSSLSQLSLLDDHSSTPRSSLASSPSTVSVASSLVDNRQLDSGVDLQESPRPVNRRSNRDFRIIPADEIEVMNETTLQESIRHSQLPPKKQQQQPASSGGAEQQQQQQQPQHQSFMRFDKSPILELEEDEDSYFGDILDKYCNNSDDESTPSTTTTTTSRLTSASPLPERKTQPPTPPASRSSQLQQQTQPPPRRGSAAAATSSVVSALRNYQSSSSLSEAFVQNGHQDSPGRNRISSSNSSSGLSSSTQPNNVYLHNVAITRESQDSLARAVLAAGQAPTTTTTVTARTYAKRPLPPPKDDQPKSTTTTTTTPITPMISSTTSTPTSTPPTAAPTQARPTSSTSKSSGKGFNIGRHFSNDPFLEKREAKPEPPPKDSSRRLHQSGGSNNNGNNNNNRSITPSQPPMLSLDTHTSENFGSFADVVEATMNKHRVSSSSSLSQASTPSTASRGSNSAVVGESISHPQPSSVNANATRPRTSSTQGPPITMPSHQGVNRHAEQQPYQIGVQNGRPDQRPDQRQDQRQGHKHVYEQQGHGQPRRPSKDSNHTSLHHQQQNQQQPYSLLNDKMYRMHGSTSQLELSSVSGTASLSKATASLSSSRSYNQLPPQFLNERARSYSQGSLSAASSAARQEFLGSLRGPKSALIKTPIARARAREARGARKVNFGEMITVITVERAETPPPAPTLDKKARKKLTQAKKNAFKEGKGFNKQNFDPEYNAAYFNAPYTPTPADVIVTLAPWIGNPNYDEEKQNSKFYYDDDYDYDDDEDYEAPYQSDIRLGPEDEDEDEDEIENEIEDEDDEDYEELRARPWGNGIAGPTGRLPKKKSGMFKFKRAVNKLLRN
ncbi:hypothetical protein B0O80DRAFT_421216 [Mortierella sp. GBAus27b]|nr:hypothetical protein BGX31_006693 [Mortierella sp. GBA43]KAI8363493.1 hypothetical protein B0O80DRAFT_421216 [Mortierella sp. GBAus27b]